MRSTCNCLVVALMALTSLTAHAGENPYPRDWFWGDDAKRAKHDELIGQPAPELKLSHWINGEVTAEDITGKIIVVDFWATWCGPCIGSIPHNNEVAEKYADQGVIVLGVCGSSRGQEKMPQVAEDHDIQYPVARDATLESAEAWRVMWWPTYGVIDREGNLRALGLKPNYVENVLDQLLEEQPAQTDEEENEQD